MNENIVGCSPQGNQQAYPNKNYLVEVVIPGVPGGQTGTIFNFPSNIQQINGKKINRIWTFSPTGAGAGVGPVKAPSGNQVFYPTSSVDIFFSLFVNGYEQIAKVPYLQAARIAGAGAGLFVFGQVVDWPISAIYLTAAPGNTANQSVLFLVEYF